MDSKDTTLPAIDHLSNIAGKGRNVTTADALTRLADSIGSEDTDALAAGALNLAVYLLVVRQQETGTLPADTLTEARIYFTEG